MRWLKTKADFLRIKPILKINQESRSKSFFSGKVSVIKCGVVMSLAVYFLINLFSRTYSSLLLNTITTLDLSRNISNYC